MTTERTDLIDKITKSARSQLPNGSVVSPNPDHPLLLSGPDILVGSEGVLFAIFVAKKSETNRPKELTARLTATRLALPDHARCLVGGDGIPAGYGVHFDGDIDQRLSPAHLSDAQAKANLPLAKYTELNQARALAFSRYAALQHIRRMWESSAPRTVSLEAKPDLQADTKRWHGSRGIKEYKGVLIGLKKTEGSRNLRSALHEYTVQAFSENYDLIEGVPQPRRQKFDLAAIDALPKQRLDPDKPNRVAAFSGWLFTDRSELSNLDELVPSTERLYAKTLDRLEKMNRRRFTR
ncbi:hypothetical protein [Rhizobium mesosinicum]|uniref:Uncharacterized protein n=1 Tax=Rhizobium mesosinicum TaxID=335017 RepID=A0ABS7GM69_9HYPH|nr:hypothetical protein [Rhizobium mesosinicum]MBW9051074.1 hypothetical protein [Rhizobium mesosinicum]